MKRAYLLLSMILISSWAGRAQVATAYFMDHTIERYMLNPALAPTRGYLAFPAIGSTGVELNTNSLTVRNFLFPRDGKLVTFLDPSVDGGKFLSSLPAGKMRLAVDASVNLLKWGWWRGEAFWSMGAALRVSGSVKIPTDLMRLIKSGTGTEGQSFDMGGLKGRVDSYIELSLGYTAPLENERWTVGVRPKILLGLAGARGGFSSMRADMTGEKWTVSSIGGITTAMHGLELKEDAGYVDGVSYTRPAGVSELPDMISGGGLAVDAGANYRLTDRITLSASLLDVGFISWSSRSVNRYAASGSAEFNGFEVPIDKIDQQVIEDQINAIADNAKKMVQFHDANRWGAYNTALPARILVGGEYNLRSNHLSFGLLSSTRFYYAGVVQELTASVNWQPARWFGASASYSAIHGYNTLGFALNLSPKGFNIFLGTDYIPLSVSKPWGVPINARGVNVNFGLGFTFGELKE